MAAILALLFSFVLPSGAQGVEALRRKARQGIESQRSTAQEEITTLRDRANQSFSTLLGRPWQSRLAGNPFKNPYKAIPSIEPVTASAATSSLSKKEPVTVVPSPGPYSSPNAAFLKADAHGASTTPLIRFTFYSYNCAVHFNKTDRISLPRTDESAVSRAWEELSGPKYVWLAADFQQLLGDLHLCDWMALQLAEAVSVAVFSDASCSEAVLMQVWLLSQCGLRLALLADSKGLLHKLVATEECLFDYPMFLVGTDTMYLLDGTVIEKAKVQEAPFQGTRPLCLSGVTCGAIPERSRQGQHETVDANRIDLYGTYPAFCAPGEPASSFYYLANVPLSRSAQTSLYPRIRKEVAGKSSSEVVSWLLAYVQQYPYRTDESVWRQEHYFFPEETLYYPYSDCEDRALLFSRLVRDLAGCDVVLVLYPGHLATAVCLSGNVRGDYVEIGGEKYWVCDPSYIGAGIGMEMPGLDTSQTKVIKL